MTGETSLHNYVRKDLGNAISNGELFICYQPMIDVKTKRTVWMEALLRWKHPIKGVINPAEFIPVAEETRLIIPIGRWVLQNACMQLKKWYEMGCTGFGLAVNVSAIQLQQPDFAEVVERILTENKLLPKCLELEITESEFIGSHHTAAWNLNLLRSKGVKISIDDFGTGYNSLKYVQKLTIDSIKIDRMFISDIKADINKAIIDMIILLGHKVNAQVTAEGVETREQYEYLKRQGCDKIQGYYFSKPLLQEDVIKFLKINISRNEY